MPGRRVAQNLQMPTPGTDKAGKCPEVARGGGWRGAHYCHLEQASLAMGRACFCFVYRTKNISFLLFWFMAYKASNIIFEAPF